ncbi:signal peptide plus transmembrane domain or GPI anchor [Cryptosporidium sp. chipmunk genotype I]|uniref:signal peptide plus transmembrane domain or GPI anchor n=1 Tax=Cryptosporidium sp. chipmunk genotype I TaxID=1280935 RepID=UPI00351A552B|nr:signal peptide plus transmembrane domain or GPI anchor [Cryptosporidium sp. chipmunk genotype I]
MNKNLLICHFLLQVVILLSINGSSLGKKFNLANYEECENPEYLFPWGTDYLNACLGFQCHKVRQHKSWYRFWERKPKYIHKNIDGNEQVIQCSDCEGFLKKGTLFGGMSICTPIEFGGSFDTPKGWVSIATASLQLNKEIKNKSSIKLVPDNWRIDGETSKSTLDLSSCSTSDSDSEIALSILVTLSNIADPSRKSPKYRHILGLSDDSINVRIKTLGINMENSMDGFENEDFYDDNLDDDGFESEDIQQNMAHDDGSNEYFLYDMNKVASTHYRIPRDQPSKGKANNERKVRKKKPFTGAERLPRKWKLSKGQTSIYLSSDVFRLDLASDIHPNELVQVVLTCNNRYMNCNIQDFVSCFNILCKSVTKEELIRRAALKKAKQFVSNSIISGRTVPMAHYGMQFQPGFPPVVARPLNNQFQYPHKNNVVNLNAIQKDFVPTIQKGVLRVDANSIQNKVNNGMIMGKNKGGVPANVRVQANASVGKGNVGVPRMVFVDSSAQNINMAANVKSTGISNISVQPPKNITTASQNVTAPNGLQMIFVPNQDKVSIQCQSSNNMGHANANMVKPLSKQKKQNLCTNKVIILKGSNHITDKMNNSLKPTAQKQFILGSQKNQSTVPEPTAPAATTWYILKGLNTNIDQTSAKLIMDQRPSTNKTSALDQTKLVCFEEPIKAKNTSRAVPKADVNEVKLVKKPVNIILLNGDLDAKPKKVTNVAYPGYKVFKLNNINKASKSKIEEILIKNAPKNTKKTCKLIKPKFNIINVRALENTSNKDSGKKILKLVPVEASSRSRYRTLSSDFDLINQDNYSNQKIYLRQSPSSYSKNKVFIEKPIKFGPQKKDIIQVIQPDFKKYAYIPDKKASSLKTEKYIYPDNIIEKVEDSESFSDYEFESDDVGYLSEDEFSTLVLKKVQKKNESLKPIKLVKAETNSKVFIPPQEEKNENDIKVREKKRLENIEKHESGFEIENSSLSDSSVYEINSQHKNYNYERSTMKSILGYSISISVLLFIAFIIMKLFLL